jgi:hypothetical protein
MNKAPRRQETLLTLSCGLFTLDYEMGALPLHEFSSLALQERADMLWREGTFLLATDNERGRSAFYIIADYYVEVLMLGAEQRIAEVVPFYTGPRLERLLSVIDLAKLG